MNLGHWADAREHFALGSVPAFGNISGGRTSAMMAALMDERIPLFFQNTSREHPGTLEFLQRLEDGLQRPIIWLEYRSPPNKGDAPRFSQFAIVTPSSAATKGELFRQMLEDIRDYRATKDEGPISPWARQRLCTAYLKHRVMDKYIKSLGVDAYDSFIGLRKDEPERVANMRARETQNRSYRCPLSDAGIVKADVMAFFKDQLFDLEIADNEGNCTGCFLKDESDLARVMNNKESDLQWWEGMRRDFPRFGGKNFKGYATLAAELPTRLGIERSLRAGVEPIYDGVLPHHRYRLVKIQEQRRYRGELAAFSCACESTQKLADDEDAQGDLLPDQAEAAA